MTINQLILTTIQQNFHVLSAKEYLSGLEKRQVRLRRVSAKKMKSYVHFTIFCNSDIFKDTKSCPHGKKIYSLLGKYRKQQVALKHALDRKLLLGKEDDNIKTYIQEQQDIIRKKISTYNKQCGSFYHTEFEKVKQYIENTKPQQLIKKRKKYQNSIARSIHKQLSKKNIKEKNVHTIRKLIKHLLYISELFNDDDQRNIYLQFSKLLGRWNDKVDMVYFLKEYNKKHSSCIIEKLLKEMKKKKKKEYKEVTTILQKYYNYTIHLLK